MTVLKARTVCLAAALTVSASPAAAQSDTAKPGFPRVRFSGRLQVEFFGFNNSPYDGISGVGTSSTGTFIRRARIQADFQLSESISGVIQPSYEGGRVTGVRLRDAFVDWRVTRPAAPLELTLRFGQEKRPFGRYELTSSNNLPSIERGAGRGLIRVGSNDLFEFDGYLAHDLGIAFLVKRGTVASLHAGIYNGSGETIDDVNDAKSYGVRGEVQLTRSIGLGASLFSHDAIFLRAAPALPDSSFRTLAWGLDAQWGRAGAPGLFALIDYYRGQDRLEEKPWRQGLSALAAYHVPLSGGSWAIRAIEPALRFDWNSVDNGRPDTEAYLVTAVFGLYLTDRAILRLAYEQQTFGSANAILSAPTINLFTLSPAQISQITGAGGRAIRGMRGMMQVAF